MPNWVYNSLYVTGNTADLQAMKAQLNSPVTTYHLDFEYESLEPRKVRLDENGNAIRMPVEKTMHNPVFSFMNVVAKLWLPPLPVPLKGLNLTVPTP